MKITIGYVAVLATLLAGLMLPGIAAANTTNTIPFTNSFENYASPPVTIVGVDGWYADDTNVLIVVTNPADMYESYLGDLPLTNETHAKMLVLDGSGTNLCTNAVDDFFIDMMVQPKRWEEEDPPDVPTNAMRTAFYFNTNGRLVVYGAYSKSGVMETGWQTTASYQVGTAQWVRLTVDLRLGEGGGKEKFRVFIDSQEMFWPNGTAARTDDPPTNSPGPWLEAGNYNYGIGTAHKISGIGLSGTGKFDDFQTSITNPLGEVFYNISVTTDPDGGAETTIATFFKTTADASAPFSADDLNVAYNIRPYPNNSAYLLDQLWIDGVEVVLTIAQKNLGYGDEFTTAENHTIVVTADPQAQQLTIQTDGASLPCVNNPTNGVYPTQYVYGVQVDLQSTDSSPATTSTSRHSCAWARVGSDDASGESQGASVANSSFTITEATTHTWLWHTEYSLAAGTKSQHGAYSGTEGNLNVASKTWYDKGSNAVVIATPAAAAPGTWSFSHWSGDTNDSVIVTNQITQTMNDANTNLVANFIYTPRIGSNWNLTVSSLYGNPTPGTGTTVLADGDVTNCIVNQSVITANTQQYCIGWTGSGAAPASGSTTNTGLFVMTDDTTVTWNWQTRYKLTMVVSNDGTTDPVAGDSWQDANAYALVTATPDAGASFISWGGTNTNDIVSGTQVSVFMDGPRTITANFSVAGDRTANGTLHTWLLAHNLTNGGYEAQDVLDPDSDGALTWEEFIAGTDPTNPASYFRVLSMAYTPSSNRVTFYGTTNSGLTNDFRIYRSTNLTTGAGWEFQTLKPRDPSGTNEWWDTAPPSGKKVYYRPNAFHIW